MHSVVLAASLAAWTAGRSSAIRIPVMVITTNNSTRVNARRRGFRWCIASESQPNPYGGLAPPSVRSTPQPLSLQEAYPHGTPARTHMLSTGA
jgi:hypothetical protein